MEASCRKRYGGNAIGSRLRFGFESAYSRTVVIFIPIFAINLIEVAAEMDRTDNGARSADVYNLLGEF